MTKLLIDKIIKDLQYIASLGEGSSPKGLARGLTIRVERVGALWMLAAWREGVDPSDDEVTVLVEAVKRLDDPQIVIRDRDVGVNGRYHGVRLYWSAVPVVISWLRPATQGRLFEVGGHNYG